MAIIYNATLTPGKLDLIGSWLVHQPWGGELVDRVGAYRFDDPAGDVGIETHLLSMRDGGVVHVPVTYRAEPFDEGELLGTSEHSVLGKRWFYEGCSDPVYVAAAVTAVLTGAAEATVELVTASGRETRPSTTHVTGSGDGVAPELSGLVRTAGDPTIVRTGGLDLQVLRRVGAAAGGGQVLTGTWPGQSTATVLLRVLNPASEDL